MAGGVDVAALLRAVAGWGTAGWGTAGAGASVLVCSACGALRGSLVTGGAGVVVGDCVGQQLAGNDCRDGNPGHFGFDDAAGDPTGLTGTVRSAVPAPACPSAVLDGAVVFGQTRGPLEFPGSRSLAATPLPAGRSGGSAASRWEATTRRESARVAATAVTAALTWPVYPPGGTRRCLLGDVLRGMRILPDKTCGIGDGRPSCSPRPTHLHDPRTPAALRLEISFHSDE